MKRITKLLSDMHPTKRRRFLKYLGATLAAPTVPAAVRYAANEVAGGKAYADGVVDSEGTLFVELNLRDQWDQGHVFVAPGLAASINLRRGETGRQAALYYTQEELVAGPRRFYLTSDSDALLPHLDDIACIEATEVSLGNIHGHEAANAIRSPGRTYSDGPGRLAMYENDPVSNFPQGCERFFATTPTPASLHNYHQKQLDPTLRNGFAFKGISRSIHTAYHFAAGLPGAELDRMRSKDQLFEAFPAVLENLNVLDTPEEAQVLTQIMERLDQRFLARQGYDQAAFDNHRANLVGSREVLYVSEPRLVDLPLTPEEEAYWSDGVPNQMCTRDDTESFECDDSKVKAQIWEQMAYATKVLVGGLTRSVALEFDYMDLHGVRPEVAVRTQAQQLSRTLARMIEQFKAAGVWNRTVIAVYTTDGSRSVAAGSYGDSAQAKNTLILAGGAIEGGYYGDITVDGDNGDGHDYRLHTPDPDTGMPTSGTTGKAGRLDSARVWKSVARALCIPESLSDQFADVQGAQPYDWLFKA